MKLIMAMKYFRESRIDHLAFTLNISKTNYPLSYVFYCISY